MKTVYQVLTEEIDALSAPSYFNKPEDNKRLIEALRIAVSFLPLEIAELKI